MTASRIPGRPDERPADPFEAQVQRSRARVDELLGQRQLTPEQAGELQSHRRYATGPQLQRIAAAQTAHRERKRGGSRSGGGDRLATQRDVERLLHQSLRESEQRIRDALDGVV